MRWFAWCWCGCGSRSRVFDSEHRRAGALPGVEPLRRLDVRLIPQHQPAEVVDRIAQPRLNIRHHLCRTPRVVSDAADGLACAHRVRKVPALCRPKMVSKKRCRHVTSLAVAGAPSPSSPLASDVPSPQSSSNTCSSTVRLVSRDVLDICMLRLALVIVEPGGMLPAMSKASAPRRIKPTAVLPVKK